MTPPIAPSPFYPIVPDADWARRIAPLGVRTIQLRIKEAGDDRVRADVRAARDVCRIHDCLLIVNDHWRIAIEEACSYVHLGQEDLASADLAAIRRAGIRFGVSTHDLAELDVALRVDADYVALGPVYETRLKAMPFAPQGLDRVREWKLRIGEKPLVAIGGLTPERADGVASAGADSLAVITDFITHPEPEARIGRWLAWEGSLSPAPQR